MYSDDDLDAAVAAGVLSPAAVAGFRQFVAQGARIDEEQFRLLTGFNDIFVSIAALLLLAAIGWLGGQVDLAVGSGAVMLASWALAEYFTRRRRLALPSILLLLAFVLGLLGLTTALLAVPGFPLTVANYSYGSAAATAITAAGTYAHWRRFRVPITVAAGLATLLGAILMALTALLPSLRAHWQPLLLLGGLGQFAMAMRWDMSDRLRLTRRADVAFWLHLSAAPMIVHPTFALLGLLGRNETSLGSAGGAIAIYLVLALVALAVDRRALLVSALFYVIYATSALFQAAGSLNASFALTALVIGSALLLLSAFWHRARALVLAVLPMTLRARLPLAA